MKKIIAILLFSTCTCALNAQLYSEPEKVKVKKEKKQKPAFITDSTKFYKGKGFVINASLGFNRGVSSGYYTIVDEYAYNYTYLKAKGAAGFRFGAGIRFFGRKAYSLEVPLVISFDRFKLTRSGNIIHNNYFEFGTNQYYSFLKAKHYVLLGEYIAIRPTWYGLTNSAGLNIGYGYNIMERLNVSFRFKLNAFKIFRGEETILKTYQDTYYGGRAWLGDYSHSIQLIVRYDIVNVYNKKKTAKTKKDAIENENVKNNIPQQRTAVDYSGYSDSDLNIALKDANTKGDLDAMLAIQKEIDKRKQTSEFTKYSYVQLQQELNKALDKEDYKQAELIKQEMAKRDTQKGIPTENSGNDLESKSLEELKKLKNEAVEKEDYDRAKIIQDVINKKKPN